MERRWDWGSPASEDDPAVEAFYCQLLEQAAGEATLSFLECILRVPFLVPVASSTWRMTLQSKPGEVDSKPVPVLRRYRQITTDCASVVPPTIAWVMGDRIRRDPPHAAPPFTLNDVTAALTECWLAAIDANEDTLVETIVEVSLPGGPESDKGRLVDLVAEAINDDLLALSTLGARSPVRRIVAGDISHVVPVCYFDVDLISERYVSTFGVVASPFPQAHANSVVDVAASADFTRRADELAGLSQPVRNVVRFLDQARSLRAVGLAPEAVIAAQTAFEILVYAVGQAMNQNLEAARQYRDTWQLRRHLNRFRDDLAQDAAQGWFPPDSKDAPVTASPDDLRLREVDSACCTVRNAYVHRGEPISMDAASNALSSVGPAMRFLTERFDQSDQEFPAACELLAELSPLLRDSCSATSGEQTTS